jgi:Zn finger protein HypA/HybF involved in hydrogenase expression
MEEHFRVKSIMRWCPKCKKTREHTPRSGYCKKCRNKMHRIKYHSDLEFRISSIKRNKPRVKMLQAKNRAIKAAYLKEHPCVDCGNADIRVLDFDHQDPSVKEFNIGCDGLNRRTALLLLEIKKCDIRCANCHRIKHALLRTKL